MATQEATQATNATPSPGKTKEAKKPASPPSDIQEESFGETLELVSPFVRPVLGQVIRGEIIRKADKENRFDRSKPKRILVMKCLRAFDNGPDKEGVVSTIEVDEEFRFDVRSGYDSLWELPIGTQVQLTNKGQTVDTGKPHKGWDWGIQHKLPR